MPVPFLTGLQFSNIPLILVDVTAGENTIVIANTRFLQMIDFEQQDVLGKPICSVFEQITDPASIGYMSQRLVEDEPGTWEIACERADGSTFLASVFMHPLRDKSGLHQQHIVSFYTSDSPPDIVSANTRDVHLLYQHAPAFIATTEGLDHRITFTNDAYKLFVGCDDFVGQTVSEAMPEIAEQGFVALLDEVLKTGVPYRGEAVPFDFPHAETGAMVRRYANFVYQPVRDKNRNVIGIFCEGYDVTEQMEAKAAVRLMNTQVAHASRVNAMGTMATTLAHELNQPLSVITNYSGGCLRLIESNELEIQVMKKSILAIQTAAKRAGAIIRTLRDITDRKVTSPTVFDLAHVIEETVDFVRSACSLETQIDTSLSANMIFDGDRIQIQQVMINLVRNACEAVAGLPAPKIRIAAEQRSDEVIVSVRDTGPGIAQETKEKLFTWSESTKDGGLGLGLSISRTIIEAHGGHIWLEESSDAGTEFRFSLPVKCLVT